MTQTLTRTATRIDNFSQSPIRAMTQRCEAVGGVNLGQGLCQVSPPLTLLEEGSRRFSHVGHSYSNANGDPDFLQAVGEKLKRYNGIDVQPSEQVIATVGATGAFNATLLAMLNPGDGVVVIEPHYGYHMSAIRLFGLLPQPVRLSMPGFTLEPEALRDAVTDGTRAIVLCTPANPCGRRFTTEELAHVAAVAQERDLVVITDEIYEHIYYTGEGHLSPATVAGLEDRTLTISGLSKSYSIPGWRLGYISGPRELIRRVRVVADCLSVCAPTPLQQIACHALSLPDSYYQELRQMYGGKRRRLTDAFAAAGLAPNHPEGTYYLFVDCSGLSTRDGWSAAEVILEQGGVATIPGEAFYVDPPERPFVRACFSMPDAALDQAADGLRRISC
jgi:aminotransferase